MDILDTILSILNLQIKNSDVKLPKISAKSPKIQDNNQAIHNGAINESESKLNLRSKTKAKQINE